MAVATKSSPTKKEENGRTSRLSSKLWPTDVVDDTSERIRETGQMIRRNTWASVRTQSPLLSLGNIFQNPELSKETKQLLRGATDEIQEFREEQERNWEWREHRQEEQAEIEQVIGQFMEVIETEMVRKGSVIRYVKVLRPLPKLTVGTLDPHAKPAESEETTQSDASAGGSASSSAKDGQAARTEGYSNPPTMNESIIDRGYGFQRASNQVDALLSRPSERRRNYSSLTSRHFRSDFT